MVKRPSEYANPYDHCNAHPGDDRSWPVEVEACSDRPGDQHQDDQEGAPQTHLRLCAAAFSRRPSPPPAPASIGNGNFLEVLPPFLKCPAGIPPFSLRWLLSSIFLPLAR